VIAKIFRPSIFAAVVALVSPSAFAKGGPTSAEQLRSELESALKAKDTNAVISLFNWEGVPEEDKEMTIGMCVEAMLKTNIASVALSPLSTNFQAMMSNERNGWQGDNGWRVKFSVTVLGELDVCTLNGDKEPLEYGEKDKFFYIAAPIAYQAPGKSLYVRVLRYPLSLTYTGSWVYVKDGREITVNISDRTNQFRQGWGDYIKSCAIRRTSTNTPGYGNDFYFEISEGGTNIFKSPQMTNQDPVIYETKQPVEPPRSAEQIKNEIETAIKAEDAEWRKDRERELPVRASYRISDDCILVFQNYSKENLSLTVTAKDEINNLWREDPHPARTNACQFDLAGGTTKDIDLLAGWRITTDDRIRVEIVNPKYDTSYIYITDAHTTSHKLAEQQGSIFKEFNQTNNEAEKDRDAHILSNLWHDGLLDDGIKDQLVQDHYQLVLRQIIRSDGGPSFKINCSQTFPFPNISTEFIPTRYLNNQVKWFPGETAKSHHGLGAMSDTNSIQPCPDCVGILYEFASGHNESGFIQYMEIIGGGGMQGWYPAEYKNGDVVQFQIDLMQTVNGHSWQTSLWSNKIVLKGLKN
jgi:hypothetical protein